MAALGGGLFLMSEVLLYRTVHFELKRARGDEIGENKQTEAERESTHPSTEMCSGSEAGSYFRLIDSCIT